MDTFLLRVFQEQARFQCECYMDGHVQLNAALENRGPMEIFIALQNMLSAGANLSKVLWGSGGKLIEERRPIRESIGASDEMELRQVTLRNHFEHMDERIDRWWKESEHHHMADMNIGSAQIFGGFADIDSFRQFDPQSGQLIFWGQSFNITAITAEVTKLLPALRLETSKPPW